MVVLAAFARGFTDVDAVEPLGSVRRRLAPTLLVSVKLSPASRVTNDADSTREPPEHVTVTVEGDATACAVPGITIAALTAAAMVIRPRLNLFVELQKVKGWNIRSGYARIRHVSAKTKPAPVPHLLTGHPQPAFSIHRSTPSRIKRKAFPHPSVRESLLFCWWTCRWPQVSRRPSVLARCCRRGCVCIRHRRCHYSSRATMSRPSRRSGLR